MADDPPGKRNGLVQPAEFEELFRERLGPVVAHLKAEHPDAGFDESNLAVLMVQFLHFMEDISGKTGQHRNQTKIPMKLFKDVRPDGPLFVLAVRMHQIRKQRGFKDFDFTSPPRRRENVELYMNCRRELEKLGLIPVPKVYIDPSCSAEDQAKLREAIVRLGGQVMAAAGPSVTHHVMPFPASGDPDDGKVYLRVQEFRGLKALVHWWYLPDSYDEYVNRDAVPDQLQVDVEPQAGTAWKVYVRWVYDSDKYNEWMNPTDYEAQDEQEGAADARAKGSTAGHAGPLPHQAGGAGLPLPGAQHQQQQGAGAHAAAGGAGGMFGAKRPPSPGRLDGLGGGLGVAKRPKPAVEALPELAPGPGERVGVNAVRHKLQEPHKAVAEAALSSENISQGQLVASAGASRAHQLSELQALVSRQVAAAAAAPASTSSAGGCPGWFSFDQINEREREGVPEFFNGRSASLTPQIYKEYRNHMIHRFREQPDRKLAFSDVKNELAGDVGTLRRASKLLNTQVITGRTKRVFEFLEAQGIINRTEPPGTSGRPYPVPVPAPNQSAFKAAMQRDGTQHRFIFCTPENAHEEGLPSALSGGNAFNLLTRKGMFAHKPAHDHASMTDHYCAAMPWIKCNEIRYHCTKMTHIELSPQAFAQGLFPPGTCGKDYVRVDHRQPQPDESGWTGAENQLLLAGLEMFGDNWAQVADYVGTRSQVQCILQFLQMPIEDLFINEMESGARSSRQQQQQQQGGGKASAPLPFADTPNSVMSQIAFLTTMVSPKIASAAAMRALEVLGEQMPSAVGAPPGGPADEQTVELSTITLPIDKVTEAATCGLAAAAAEARKQAEHEERELQRLVTTALQVQAQKLEVKLKYLASLDHALEAEHTSLDATRAQSDAELQNLRQMRQGLAAAGGAGPAPPAVAAGTGAPPAFDSKVLSL